MDSPPNILLIITDQQSADTLSCAGNPWLQTPHMDALAARGTRFERAYCSYPLCTPSRASQMTGRLPHSIGTNGNEGKFFWYHDIPPETYLSHHFEQAGWDCVWAGKDMPPEDGSRGFRLLCPWGDAQTAEYIADYLGEEHDRPFLAVANFVDPHNICEYSKNKFMPEGPLPPEPPLADMPLLPANHAVPPHEPQIIRLVQQDGVTGAYPGAAYDQAAWRRYLWAYYRLIERVDALIGQVIAALDASAHADNTLVVFCSDHGDGSARHRWNQKQTLYEESIRVPLILAGPGVQAGAVDSHLVSSCLDLWPTLAEASGVPCPTDLPGRSLLGLCRGERPGDWRSGLVVETVLNGERNKNAPPNLRNAGRALVCDRFKYSAWLWGEDREQLIDLQADPGEMVNLAASSAYTELRDQCREVLQEECQASDDFFAVPGHEIGAPQAGWDEAARLKAEPPT